MVSFADCRIYVVADGGEERVESGGLASLGQETWDRDHDRVIVCHRVAIFPSVCYMDVVGLHRPFHLVWMKTQTPWP